MTTAVRSVRRPARLLIADDHALVREGLKLLVSGLLGKADVLEVGDGDALLQALATQPVQLALIDVQIPRMQSGLRLAELARRHPDVPLVLVSALDAPDTVRRMLQIPTVFAFVHKAAHPAQLTVAIDAAFSGRKFCCLRPINQAPPPSARLLTPRQEQVRSLLSQGYSNKLIANALGISQGTVKNHITEILRLLNATNRTQAARLGPELE